MVRELKLDYKVEGFSAKELYQLVFLNDDLTRQFHATVNKDPNAEVGPWEDNVRTVKFTMEVNLPASLRKMIGEGTFPVKEKQELQWLEEGSCFQATSTPRIQLSVAAGFKTKVLFKVSTHKGVTPVTSDLNVTVTCTAEGIWPLQGTVEGIMIEEGKMRVGGFAEFVLAHCKTVLAEREAAAAAAAAAGIPPLPPALAIPAAAAAAAEVAVPAAAAAAAAEVAAALPLPVPAAVAVGPPPVLPLVPAVGAGSFAGGTAAAAAGFGYEGDVYYDAAEELPSATARALVAQQQLLQKVLAEVQETNRHLEAMSKSVQHIDLEVTRALAYQEGLQAGQRAAAASSYLWGSALLAAAVGGSVGLVLMRSKLRG